MRSDSLLKFVTFSDMRRNLLFKLLEGPMSLTELKDCFEVTSSDIIPRIKDLEKENLILKDNGKYCLLPAGKILAKNLQAMSSLSSFIEENGQFLNEHDLSSIPDSLLYRIDELGKCEMIENGIDDASATLKSLFNNLSRSNSIIGVTAIFDAYYPGFFLSMAQRDIPMSIVFTEYIYKKIEKDYLNELLSCCKHHNAKLYVIEDARLAFVVTDTFLSMSLSNKNGTMDHATNLISFEKPAIRWGEELFEYYRQNSKEIKD